jgi:hypothetical protein
MIRAQLSSDTVAKSCGITVKTASPVLALCRVRKIANHRHRCKPTGVTCFACPLGRLAKPPGCKSAAMGQDLRGRGTEDQPRLFV